MSGIKTTPADHWFSLCIRQRANWTCQRCGKKNPPPSKSLHCAHYEGRGNWATRFDPLNCFALCHGCHSFLDGRKIEFEQFYISINGRENMEYVRRTALDHAGLAKEYRRTKGVGDIARHFMEQYNSLVSGASSTLEGFYRSLELREPCVI
jgi:hypothetical protein